MTIWATNFSDDSPGPLSTSTRSTRWVAALLMSWTCSLLIHLAAVFFVFFLIWSSAFPAKPNNIIPQATFSANPTPESLLQTQDVQVSAPSDISPAQQPDHLDIHADSLANLSTQMPPDIPLISFAADLPLPPAVKTDTPPLQVQMFGVTGDARNIIYCVDASGSLMDVFAYVIDELKSSLRKLSPQQRFTVIFFQENHAIEVPTPHPGWKRATRPNINAVIDWISQPQNIHAHESSNPLAAIQLAFSYRPQLMYILSDDITHTVNRDDLLQDIQMAKDKSGANTKINTIQFIYEDPQQTLKIIANLHNGNHRFVNESIATQQ